MTKNATERKALARRRARELLAKKLPAENSIVDYDAKVNLRDGGDGAWVTVHVWVPLCL